MKKLYMVEMTAVTYGESMEEASDNVERRILVADDIIEVKREDMFHIKEQKHRAAAIENLMQTLRRLDNESRMYSFQT